MFRRTAHLMVLGLLLCSLGVQQWAAGSHWHAAGGESAASAPGLPADSGNAAPDHDCLACQIAAHAGGAAPLPSWAGWNAPAPTTHIALWAAVRQGFPIPIDWAWHSRGPPAC